MGGRVCRIDRATHIDPAGDAEIGAADVADQAAGLGLLFFLLFLLLLPPFRFFLLLPVLFFLRLGRRLVGFGRGILSLGASAAGAPPLAPLVCAGATAAVAMPNKMPVASIRAMLIA